MKVDVRIVGATNEDLPAAVDAGRFRADLLDRLSFEVITLPPLRHRNGDVPVLADHFGRRMAAELGWPHWPGFAADAVADLERHDWPGNVRELRNVVERAVYRWDDPERPVGRVVFDPFKSPWKPAASMKAPAAEASAPAPVQTGDPGQMSDFRSAVDAHEVALLTAALERHRYNQRATAKALGLSYDQLRHCLRKHGLL
jgi:psp operon transcriptional activator